MTKAQETVGQADGPASYNEPKPMTTHAPPNADAVTIMPAPNANVSAALSRPGARATPTPTTEPNQPQILNKLKPSCTAENVASTLHEGPWIITVPRESK